MTQKPIEYLHLLLTKLQNGEIKIVSGTIGLQVSLTNDTIKDVRHVIASGKPTEDICSVCQGSGGYYDGDLNHVDEFGNGPDWIPCDDCYGTGVSPKILGSLENAEFDKEFAAQSSKRDSDIEERINKMLTFIKDGGTGGDNESTILGSVIFDLEDLKNEFWPEPPDEPADPG